MEYKAIDLSRFCSGKKHKAGPILVTILNELEDSKLNHKIGVHLHRYKRLESVISNDHRQYFGQFLLNDTKANIETYGYPKPVETHLLNLITGIYREKIYRS